MTDERWNDDPSRPQPSEPEAPVWPPLQVPDPWQSQPPEASPHDNPPAESAAQLPADAAEQPVEAAGWTAYQPPAQAGSSYQHPLPQQAASATPEPSTQPTPWGAPSPAQHPSPDSSAASYPTEQYAGADFPSAAQSQSPQYPSPQYSSAQYSSAQYQAADYPTAEYPALGYSSGQYPSGGHQEQAPPAYAYGSGYPSGPASDRPQPTARGRGWLPLLLVALVASLIGGGVGTAYTLANTDDKPAKTTLIREPVGNRSSAPSQPTTSLAPDGATPAPSAVREVVPGSVSSIARTLLPSIMEIVVKTNDGRDGSGSGVVIREDGYILTNNHVVADASSITVRIGNRTAAAKLVGTDPSTDLAVIQALDAGKLTPAELGTVRGLLVGDPVIAIGSPLGLAGTVTSGIVSALHRRVDFPGEDGGADSIFGAVQTDAAINPGNSGGALVDGNGKVIGINSAIASLGRSAGGQAGSIGLGFAIPIDLAKDTADQLIAKGKAVHPLIGVSLDTPGRRGGAGQTDVAGAFVAAVNAGAPADKAGLRKGDVITKLDDIDITSVDQLIGEVGLRKVGESVTVTYSRGGVETSAKLVLAEKPVR